MSFRLGDGLSGGTPRVRQPIFELTVGTGPSEDWARRLVAARVRAGLAPAADEAVIQLSPAGDHPQMGDVLTLALGYEESESLAGALGAMRNGNPRRVFTGAVTSIEPTLSGLQVRALNGGARLQRLRAKQRYETQNAGDIVRDLATQANVAIGTIESGLRFPIYVVDDRRHAYQHVASLAWLCGFDAYFTPEDELRFGLFAKTTADHVFAYAEDVLALSVDTSAAAIARVTVMGESPASIQGEDTWHWLASSWDSYRGKAGGGNPSLLVQARAIRTQEAAQTLASGLLDRAIRGATHGILRALGRAEVKVGDMVEMAGVPEGGLNGLYQVVSVYHRLDRVNGFLTMLELIAAAGTRVFGGPLGELR
jgi:phage protein D